MTDNFARAPYNFVRLPDRVIEAETPPDQDRYDVELHTGVIEFTLTAKTPLFIHGHEEIQGRDEDKIKRFFAPAGRPTIPGSELRGALSTLFEIVTWSNIRFVDDDRLFYRKIPEGKTSAAVDTLGERYVEELDESRVRAGWIRKKGSRYEIVPGRSINDRTFFKVSRGLTDKYLLQPGHQDRRSGWKRWYDISFDPQKERDRVEKLYADPDGGKVKGTVVRPGWVPMSKNDWIVTEPDENAEPIPLDTEIIERYRESSGGVTRDVRNRRFSALPGFFSERSNGGERNPLPAFFIKRKDGDRELVLFGHTRFFRVPYKRRVRHAIPEALDNWTKGSKFDLADAVFGTIADGKLKSRRTRIFVEDAVLEGEPRFEDAEQHGDLFSPRPTSYQLYLEQPEFWYRRPAASVIHWDDGKATIRGTKLYRHRPGANWKVDRGKLEGRSAATRPGTIEPLTAENRFRGRIRFENLRKYELGALLFALDLPPECCHKLGFGKPLGMGSVRIDSVRVRRSDRQERYRAFASEGALHNPEKDEAEDGLSAGGLKEAFAKWVLPKLSKDKDGAAPALPDTTHVERLWTHPRMRELRRLLDFDNAPDARETGYMGMGEFPRTKVLPQVEAELDRDGASPSDGEPGALATALGEGTEQRPAKRFRPGAVVDAEVVEVVGSKKLLRASAAAEDLEIEVDIRHPPYPYNLPGREPQKGNSVRVKITGEQDGTVRGILQRPK